MYFCYDHEDGVSFHDTPEKAEAAAQDALDGDQDLASDGWHEEVETICWGRIIEQVQETKRYPAPEGSDFDEFVEYNLVKQDESDTTALRLEMADVAIEWSVLTHLGQKQGLLVPEETRLYEVVSKIHDITKRIKAS